MDKINILLVDDSSDKLFALANELEPLGQNLVQARSGTEALRWLLKQDFALILLDVRMPGMDGFETAQLIRMRKNSEYTPIIFVTGIDRTETQVFKGYSLGAVDYLFTPVVREVLLAKVGVFIELHRKKQEIARSQKLLAQAQQVAHLGSWEWDLEAGRMFWSEEFFRILGVSSGAEAKFETFLERVYPDDRELTCKAIEQVRDKGIAFGHDVRIVRPDKEIRTLHSRGELGTSPGGKPSRILGVVFDITERKRAEEALRASEERFRSVTETALSAIITAQLDGAIVQANQSSLRIFGYSDGELIGKPFSCLFPEQFQKFSVLSNYGCPKASQMLGKTLILRGRKNNGASFPMEFSLAHWKSHDQTLFTAIISDITEREAAERKLAAEILERKAAEKKILEISGREQRRIGQELHDGLGQTLTGISFLSKALANKLAAGSATEAAGAERISALVNQAIANTRDLARGFYPVELESNGLVSALRELVAREKNLFNIQCSLETLETSAVPDLNRATQVYRIAQEAIENAIKHGKAKQVWIKLEKSGGLVHLTVRDDGNGFPAKLPKKRGMGLQIMKYRAGMIQGTFKIQRQGRRGTLVTCSFPDPEENKNHEK